MHSPSGLIIVILVFTAVLAAGCTQGTGPAAPATPVPVPGPGLQDLALKPSEVPACFSLTDQHTKSSGDVGQLAKDLGWQAGYEVMYTCPATGAEPTILVQSLAVYPAGNMHGLASMVDKQDRSAGFSYEDLTFPGQGSTMSGFYGKAGSAGVSGQSGRHGSSDRDKKCSGNECGTRKRCGGGYLFQRDPFQRAENDRPGNERDRSPGPGPCGIRKDPVNPLYHILSFFYPGHPIRLQQIPIGFSGDEKPHGIQGYRYAAICSETV